MTTAHNVWLRRKIRELRDGTKCANCGGQPVQFAHRQSTKLNGMGRGRCRRYYDWIKNPDKYVPLCSWCHRAYDRGELKI
jgi:hypothetical protein